VNASRLMKAARGSLACVSFATLLALPGCSSDGYSSGGVSTSVGVSYGYGGYYDPYYYGGGYYPYPPVVIDRPDERPDRPNSGQRPTTLPADVGSSSAKPAARPSTAPTRPATSSRPTSRPSPRPAPRPMPRGGGIRR
jgi:hypothetical protein